MVDVIVISSDSSDSDEADLDVETVDVGDGRPDPLLGGVSRNVYLSSESTAWGALPGSAMKRRPKQHPVERPKRRAGEVKPDPNDSRERRQAERRQAEKKHEEDHNRAVPPVHLSTTAAPAASTPGPKPQLDPPPRKKLRLSLSRPPPVPSPPPKDLTKDERQQLNTPQPLMPKAVRAAMRKDQELQKLLRGLKPEFPRLRDLAEDSCRREAGVRGLGYVNRAFRSMQAIADRELPISPWKTTTTASIRGLGSGNTSLPPQVDNQHRDRRGGGGGVAGSLQQQQQQQEQQQRLFGAAMDPAGLARLLMPPLSSSYATPSEGPGGSSAAAGAASVLIMRPDGAGTRVLRSRSDAAQVAAACSCEATALLRKIGGSRGTREGPAAATRGEGTHPSQKKKQQQEQEAEERERKRKRKEAKRNKRRSLGPKELTEFDPQPCYHSG